MAKNRCLKSTASPPPLFQIVVCAILINKNKKIFLARRASHKKLAGKWEFPGGKLELGEKPEEALIREIREELGITITDPQILHIKPYSYPHGNVLILFYTCDDFSAEPKIQESDHDLCGWYDLGNLKTLDLLPANAEALERLKKYLNSFS